MAAALAEPPPGFKGDLADPPPGLKLEEEPKALAEPPPGLKLEGEPKALAPPPPGLKTEEPAPAPPKKPVTIDPGVDVGFGPGVAPPDLSPVTGRPVSEKAPPTPSTPAPGVDIGFGPGVAPPADWQKQNLIPGVGVAPTEPPKVIKPPVKAAAPVTAPKPVTIDPGVDVGFGPGVAPPETTPEKAAEQAAPGATEAVKAEVDAQQKADEKAAQLPAAVTAVTYRNDPNAQGEETQAPDETGALQTGKFVYSQKERAESLVNQTPNKQDLYVRAAKIAADPNIPEAQKAELLNTFAEAATKYATSDEPGGLESGIRFAGGAIQTLLHLPGLAESLARFGFSTAQAAMVLGKIGTGQEINAQDDAVLHTLLASASEGTASAVELGENIRNWLVKSATKGTNIKVTDPNMMSWDQIKQLSPDQQKEVFLAKARWLGNRYSVAESRQKGELDPFWSEQFRNLTGHEPNTIASLAEQHIYPDTKAIPAGGMVLSPLNLIFPAGEGLIAKSLLAERGAGMVTGLTADAMSKLSWIQRNAVEPWAPAAGKIAGGEGSRAVVGALGLTHIPPPFNWLTFGALGKVKKIGGAVGEKIGQSPQWMRENLWDPAQKVVAEQANDIRNGTNNVQANYGPLAPLLMRGAGGMAKGAVIAAPFAAGAETPEEAGSTIAFGGALGGLHAAPEAARDAALSTLFFRDPDKYQSMGFKPMQYGTDYFGKNFDTAHDAWTSGQSQMDQDRINDSRGLLPNVEQYHLGNQDYQDAVTHLQNNGMLPAGNLQSRGFNILKDPNTGHAVILVNGDAPGGFSTAAHEIGHTIYRTLSPEQRDAFRNAAFQFNDPNALAQWYFGNLKGRNVNYTDLPSEAGIANGTQKYLPGLDGYTKEHFVEEMGAETVAALLRGQPLSHFIRDPSLMRRTQLALGSVLNKMGFNVTPEEATTVLGVRPGVAQMWIMDKALRDYFKQNPTAARPGPTGGGPGGGGGPGPVPPGGGGGRQGPIPKPRGRQTAATPKPTGGPAPVPPPTPPMGPLGPKPKVNNQPEIGGGPTGAPQAAIDDAVKALQTLKFAKRQAQKMVATASGQTSAELLHSALKNHQVAQGRIEVPRAPQEAAQTQAPTPTHPLAAHRDLTSPALLRGAIDGDPQATQALIERHGANWLKEFEKGGSHSGSQVRAAEFRRKYPEQAAEQDQRIKAGVESKPQPIPKAADLPPTMPPHDAIAARAYELSQERGGAPGHEQEDWAQAEKELRQRAIDAVKARFKGRAAFMPMAGEHAQPKEPLGAGIEDFAARHPFPNLAAEHSWFNPATQRFERMPEGVVDLRGKSWEDMTAREMEAIPQPQIPGFKVSFMPDIPPGSELPRLRGEQEKPPELTRRYEGAPPGVRDSRSLNSLKLRLKQLAAEGEAFRHWYKLGAEGMYEGVGQDMYRFDKLLADIAATSPQNKVYPNAGMAFRALAQQEAGGRRITIGKEGHMKERLSTIARDEDWSGLKTNQFWRDHMAEFDKRLQSDEGSTMDMWMAQALGYPTDSFTPKQSAWSQGIMREITDEIGWDKPREVQAAVWSAIKGRVESVDGPFLEEAKRNGDWVQRVTKSGKVKGGYASPEIERQYRARILKKAMQIDAPDLTQAAFNFWDAMKRDTGYVSAETRPSGAIQDQHPWMRQMTDSDWDRYHKEAIGILHDERGVNQLSQMAHLVTTGETGGYGAWETEHNMSQQFGVVMPKASGKVLKLADSATKIDPTVEKFVRDYCASLGLLYRQDGVGFHRPYYTEGESLSQKQSNGVYIDQGAPLTRDETRQLTQSLEKQIPSFEQDGAKGWFVAPDERGIRVVTWGHGDGKEVYKAVRSAISEGLPESRTVTLKQFGSYGDLVGNNWKENANGENYRRWLRIRGRSDLQRFVDDQLRPQLESINSSYAAEIARRGGGTEAVPAGDVRAEGDGERIAAAMPDVPAYPKARQPFFPAMRISPVASQTQEELERRIGIPSSVITPAPPEVRRGLIMPTTSQQQPSTPPAQQPSKQPEQPSEEPSIDIASRSYRQGRTYEGRTIQPQWIVIHSTDANERSSINTLTQGGKSVHYLTTEDGRVLHFVPEADTAFHAGIDKFGKDGNPASIGIEQVHTDGQPWNDATVQATAKTVAGILKRHPNIPLDHVIGHSNLAPGRKVDPQDYPWAKFYDYVREYMGGSAPSQSSRPSQPVTAGPDQETRRRTGSAAANHIMAEEGSSGSQDGVREIFGFRQGQDPEYEEMARLRASGDEQGVQRLAAKGFVDRAIAAGSQQFNDPAIRAAIMSLSHMRGAGGARDILNAVATGRIDNSGSVDQLDPEAVKTINSMDRAEVLRRIQIARTVYDKAVHGQEYWNRFGRGLSARYEREKQFYGAL